MTTLLLADGDATAHALTAALQLGTEVHILEMPPNGLAEGLADAIIALAPAYDAIVLISPRRANDVRLRDALKPLIGKIDIDHMRAANLSVDRDNDKRSPAQAARALAAALALPP